MQMKLRLGFVREVLVRVIADAVLVNLAYAGAQLIRFFWFLSRGVGYDPYREIASRLPNIVLQAVLLTIVALAVFAASGFYTKGRAYRGRYKALLIVQAVSLTYLIFGFLNYLLAETWIPASRHVMLIGWLLSLVLVLTARLYSTLWRQVVIKEERLHGAKRPEDRLKDVLVIGGAGYIGSVLCRKLLDRGSRVRVLDALLYGNESIQDLLGHPKFEFLQGDSRDIEAVVRAMKDMGAVVHLGEIVGDPATALDEQLTQEINVAATKMVAQAAKGYGAHRFVYASSCSVYGASEQVLTEQSALNPLSLYARAKIDSERTLLELNDTDFHPVILRFATVYGLSPRPRFDLVINLLIAKAVQDRRITIHGGDQWRPFVHVSDIAEVLIKALEAPLSNVKGQVFNVGSDEQNYTIRGIGEMIHRLIPDAELVVEDANSDRRNYRVSFSKIRRELGFVPGHVVEDAVREIEAILRSGALGHYQDKRFSNYKTLSEDNDRAIAKVRINELYAPALPEGAPRPSGFLTSSV